MIGFQGNMTRKRRLGENLSGLLKVILMLSVVEVCPGEPAPWHNENGFRWQELQVPGNGRSGFTWISHTESQIAFTNQLEEWNGAANRTLLNGSGVAIGDYNNDGLPDIYFCGLDTPNALYKNLGNWKFKDVTIEAGIQPDGKFFRGAVFADINGDGFLDLLMTSTGRGVLVFLNDGGGKFQNATAAAGTASSFGGMTLALADADGDGFLDLYVANYRASDIRDRGQVDLRMVKGEVVVPPSFRDRLMVTNKLLIEFGEPDQLFLNQRNGTFKPVPWTGGTFLDEQGHPLRQVPLDWGLTATFRDINGDGLPDLYVCNDFWTPDRIWLNQGQGRFRALSGFAIRNMSASSMGVDFADVNRDGILDFFVVDMLSRDPRLRSRQMPAQPPAAASIGLAEDRPQFMRNTIYVGREDGTFGELANYARVAASDWSWSPVFLDVDLDGFEDLIISAGHVKDVQDPDAEAQIKLRQRSYRGYTNQLERQQAFTSDKMMNERLYPRLDMPIVTYRNLGDWRFEETTSRWGTEQSGVHHGLAMADLDGDGDLDFVVNNLGGVAGIYRNESSRPRVAVRLRGNPPNTQGIGARIKLRSGAVPLQSQEVISGGRYLSGSDPLLVFAAGDAKNGMTIEVDWRDGKSSVVPNVVANRLYEISNSIAAAAPAAPIARTSPIFQDVSAVLNHSHHEEAFDDFARQPLLPRKLSQSGPGIAWFDLNGDGHDDLIVGAGKGGSLAIFLGDGRGHFDSAGSISGNHVQSRDLSGLVGFRSAQSNAVILAGSANYEDGSLTEASVREYSSAGQETLKRFPGGTSSAGPLALSDLKGDGVMALFVGGRSIPGRYPEAADSRLYLLVDGRWRPDTANNRALQKIGLVSGAVWSDLNGDGFPELILACEWGPLVVFENQRGLLIDATARYGLDKFVGWWNGVATGDVNGDGKPDIIASNWGLNSEYHASVERPLLLYFSDFNQRGILDLLETQYDTVTGDPIPRRPLSDLTATWPFLAERFSTFKAFSEAPVSEFFATSRLS